MSGDPTDFRCSFCAQPRKQSMLISGPSVFICPDCVDLCVDVVAEHEEKGIKVTMPALVERLRAELKQARDAATPPAWRPIETAPRDGTEILAVCKFTPGYEKVRVIRWFEDGWFYSGMGTDYPAYNPTHWLPLSALPAVPR